jgi:hypothetical protein
VTSAWRSEGDRHGQARKVGVLALRSLSLAYVARSAIVRALALALARPSENGQLLKEAHAACWRYRCRSCVSADLG